jgi:fermentation-respiration switch protein FrsA (DUF1100 family)
MALAPKAGTVRAMSSAFRAEIGSPGRDVLVFWTATGIVALHAIVDSFVATEPGTGPSDHLLRGIVSLGLLGAAAVAYPRLRAGGRASLAVVLGVLALEGAALAIADARAVGARGEDWTGFLLVPVGLGLCSLAVVLLWRSRKPGPRRYVRRIAIGVAAVVAAYWLVLPLAIGVLATHRPRADVEPADLGRAYETVALRTSDGLELAAWYVPSRNGAAVVSYPTRTGKVAHARMLARHGYGVLLVDARGYDGSEGDPNLFGWAGAKDVDAAVSWLRQRPDVRDGRIGGIGFSVGGEVMIQAAAANSRLRAVVSEGAGVRSVREHLLRGARGWPTLPEALLETAAVAIMSGTAPPPSMTDLVARVAPRPLFLIYAGNGQGGEDLSPRYFQAASEPKTLWKIPDAGHVGGLEARPREYEARVVGFFDRALLGTT